MSVPKFAKPSWQDYYKILDGRRKGTIPYNPEGYYVVPTKKINHNDSNIYLKQVTPVAAAIERAKSETTIKGGVKRKISGKLPKTRNNTKRVRRRTIKQTKGLRRPSSRKQGKTKRVPVSVKDIQRTFPLFQHGRRG